MKYLKSLTIILSPIIILSFLVSLLYNIGWIGTKTIHVLKFLIPLLSLFIGGIYLGKHSTKRGWLEGLKLGGGFILSLFIISYLAFDIGLSLKMVIYYFILLIATTFGSMIGIRNVEKGVE